MTHNLSSQVDPYRKYLRSLTSDQLEDEVNHLATCLICDHIMLRYRRKLEHSWGPDMNVCNNPKCIKYSAPKDLAPNWIPEKSIDKQELAPPIQPTYRPNA